MDEIDLQILSILQDEGDISRAELARRVGLTAPAVHARLEKLGEAGVIRGVGAQLDAEALGFGCLAFVLVRTDPRVSEATGRSLAALPGVLEVHDVAGEDCFLVKVRCRTPRALSGALRSFHEIDAVRSTRSTMVLDTVKESHVLPLEILEPAPRRRQATSA